MGCGSKVAGLTIGKDTKRALSQPPLTRDATPMLSGLSRTVVSALSIVTTRAWIGTSAGWWSPARRWIAETLAPAGCGVARPGVSMCGRTAAGATRPLRCHVLLVILCAATQPAHPVYTQAMEAAWLCVSLEAEAAALRPRSRADGDDMLDSRRRSGWASTWAGRPHEARQRRRGMLRAHLRLRCPFQAIVRCFEGHASWPRRSTRTAAVSVFPQCGRREHCRHARGAAAAAAVVDEYGPRCRVAACARLSAAGSRNRGADESWTKAGRNGRGKGKTQRERERGEKAATAAAAAAAAARGETEHTRSQTGSVAQWTSRLQCNSATVPSLFRPFPLPRLLHPGQSEQCKAHVRAAERALNAPQATSAGCSPAAATAAAAPQSPRQPHCPPLPGPEPHPRCYCHSSYYRC